MVIKIFTLCFLWLQFDRMSGEIIHAQNHGPRVLVIGAGVAGLCSARYLKQEGISFTVIEATNYIGGTWRYDPRVGTDENGLPLFTSMYKHLRTNLPKDAMQLLGYPVPKELISFPSWKDYYEYILSFADHFNLKKYIKFLHLVTSVTKYEDIWKVKYKSIKSGKIYEEQFDYVFVCTGHYSKPKKPVIKGENLFKGTIIHSHDYRDPEIYRNRSVLVVGSGPSGMDIGLDVAEVAKALIHSHHSVVEFNTPFPPHYKRKPDIKELTENGVYFVDGSYEEIDDVLLCTGFEFYFPFLDETSGLTLHPTYVAPLYRYMVNIHQPTMVLMGLVKRAAIVTTIDAQARYATALVKGNFTLPSKEDMLNEWHLRAVAIRARGRPMSDIHLLASKELEYTDAIAKESGTMRVPPVIFKMRTVDTAAKIENLYTYRNYEYTVIDDNTFTRRYVEPRNSTTCTP